MGRPCAQGRERERAMPAWEADAGQATVANLRVRVLGGDHTVVPAVGAGFDGGYEVQGVRGEGR